MKTHPHDPIQLAQALHVSDLPELPVEEVLADMRAHPEMYFPDHAAACRQDGTLPLSSLAWRRACRAA